MILFILKDKFYYKIMSIHNEFMCNVKSHEIDKLFVKIKI